MTTYIFTYLYNIYLEVAYMYIFRVLCIHSVVDSSLEMEAYPYPIRKHRGSHSEQDQFSNITVHVYKQFSSLILKAMQLN